MEKEFSIAIVGGTGSMGTALALRLAAPGVRVIIGSRERDKAKSVVESLQ
ncbi:MAG TPA: NAD(P)-binding domain-containing protein, partial [Candidatus Binatia bacterium]